MYNGKELFYSMKVEAFAASALCLLAVDLMLPLQFEHLRLLTAARLLCQVLEGAPRRPCRTYERLVKGRLVQVGVRAGVLVDGGHAGAVQRRWAVGRVSTSLLGATGMKAKGAGRERRRFEDPNGRRIQAAQELSILGKQKDACESMYEV